MSHFLVPCISAVGFGGYLLRTRLGGMQRACSTSSSGNAAPLIEKLHSEACRNGDATYIDPASGFQVFTALFHKERGYCCGSGCRHCPYGHANVTKTENNLTRPATTRGAKNKVYTRTGDKGTTSLFNGQRKPKCDARLQAMGDIDELNSIIGVAREYVLLQDSLVAPAPAVDQQHRLLPQRLRHIQNKLSDIGAGVANPGSGAEIGNRYHFGADNIVILERWIEAITEALPDLRSFILPSGGLAAAQLHVARTVCRRAERTLVALDSEAPSADIEDAAPVSGVNPEALKYLNRLSDFLFVVARLASHKAGHGDPVVQRNEDWVEPEEHQ
eukprot:TRINITY_DN11906_c0_g2_i1.p1 TRINITY_DN11906_c0_g2~~TRINITY_DN11906_c0_g2_i1.p1  ORF type:complete len:330 (+),score=44.39 TRINITY_DN11906_c0_g2_i1:29-1018(+)